MEIATTFSHLQAELNHARESLKGVDENIKRFLGRDPNEVAPAIKTGVKRTADNQLDEPRGRNRPSLPLGRRREFGGPREDDGPPSNKRRPNEGNVFSRLSGPVRSRRDMDSAGEEEEHNMRPSLPSQVFTTPGMIVSKQEVVHAQNPDEKSKARNRRMFGALLGTLQKFRQEETKMKEKEDKRAKVELKLEEAARQEKEQLRQEKIALFAERKRKQADIKKIEYKLFRMKEQEEWEAKQLLLVNFIKTKASPSIFYLPKIHTPQTMKLLESTKEYVEKNIEAKRQGLQEELEVVERRSRTRQERERAEEEGFGDIRRAREQERRGREQERRGRDWRDKKLSMPQERSSRQVTKPEVENHPDEDSDLEAEAGPELDVDGVGAGKEDEEGEGEAPKPELSNGDGGETVIEEPKPSQSPNAEPQVDQVITTEPTEQATESNTSMNVDEKEFEPVYDE